MKQKFLFGMLFLILSMTCGCVRNADSMTEHDHELTNGYEETYEHMTVIAQIKVSLGLSEESNEDKSHSGGHHKDKVDVNVGNSAAVFHIKHFGNDISDSYDAIETIDEDGKRTNAKWSADNYIQCLGVNACDGGFITAQIKTIDAETKKYALAFSAYDRDGNTICSVSPEFLTYSDNFLTPKAVCSDLDGNIHLVWAQNGENSLKYYVIARDGSLIYTKDLNNSPLTEYGFIVGPEGKAVIEMYEIAYADGDNNGHLHHVMEQYDCFSNKYTTLMENDLTDGSRYCPIDDKTVVFANFAGIYESDYSLKEIKPIFNWDEYEIEYPYVTAVGVMANGDICVAYTDEQDDFVVFLSEEEASAEETVIEFALTPYTKSKYSEAVHAFNKSHNNIRIVMRDDYERSALLTSLISGEGPVLIDTGLTGFIDQKNLWEPITNGLLADLMAENVLNSKAVEMGTIDGIWYGLVADYDVETALTKLNVADWDFERFIECIKANPEIKSIAGNDYDKVSIATLIFDHGYKDSFYVNNDTPNPDRPEFYELLGLIDKYGQTGNSEDVVLGEDSLNNSIMNSIYFKKPAELLAYKEVYGDEALVIGYPGKSGAESFLYCNSILAIRKNASEEEKKAAQAFIYELLSYSSQKAIAENPNFGISARNDVLKEQIAEIKKGDSVSLAVYGDVVLKEEQSSEDNLRIITELVAKAKPYTFETDDYKGILFEEFGEYFEGRITKEQLADRISKRVGLYIEERK